MSTCCTSSTCASGLAPATVTEPFPIDLGAYKKLAIDPFKAGGPTAEEEAALKANIQLCRDALVFFTAIADARGMGGHTGGPFDVIPEAVIMDAFFRGAPDKFVPIMYDEAGHRVALQYLFSVLGGHMPAEKLFHYREAHSHLPGHPEKDYTPGVKFSSGRLGHMWSFVNGVAMANPEKIVFMLGSDGSQQEGDDAEAARLAVARKLNVKLLIDDNDVTIAGFPSEYFQGYDVARTLIGHGLDVSVNDGENLKSLVQRMRAAVQANGPVALVNKRKMCVGIEGLEGSNHGHDVIKTATAIAYLEKRGHTAAAAFLKGVKKSVSGPAHKGSDAAKQCNNRDDFGKIVAGIVSAIPAGERKKKVLVIDSDLEGSCGLHHIRKACPEIYVAGGIMERGNFSSCAGFGYEAGRQGIFGTFSAFLEMCVSEITMARLNGANVLAHFSHAGCDDMADNTCHFGINNMYADNGLPEGGKDTTRLYFPADGLQMEKLVKGIFNNPGLRFVFSTRSKVPTILGENGQPFFGEGYTFVDGKDDVIREAGAGEGYIVAFGETLYRAADAVEQLKEQGRKVGLVNKATLNVYDAATMAKLAKAPWVLVAEGFNVKTGVGSRFGTELLKHGFKGKYNNIGTHHEGCGGLWEQMVHQGLDNAGIVKAVKAL